MNGRAIFDTRIEGVSQESEANGFSTPYTPKNGGNNRGATASIEAARSAGIPVGGYTARAWHAYNDGLRACRNIIARYNWLRLEESLRNELESFEAFSVPTCHRAIFEGHEPAKVVDMRLVLR